MVTSFGNGLVLPNAIAGGLGVDAKAAGAGSGMMGFGQMGLGAVMSYLGGKIVDGSALPLATLMMICAVLALIAGIFARRPEPDNGKPL
jgi:DHA1 family bicyclomycin/chloramphenicol resistance-like MFS transporter